jgi:hypothetical protein
MPMELKQREFARGKQSFKISGENLYVRMTNRHSISEFHVPLCSLSKNPQTAKFNPALDIISAVLFALMSIACLICVFVFKIGDPVLLMVFAVAGLIITSFILYLWKTRRFNYLTFHNIFSGQEALVFWINNPDKEQFELFIKCLTENIENYTSVSQNAGLETAIASEIQKLHYLWKEGILSEEEYAAGKSKVLSTNGDEWKY